MWTNLEVLQGDLVAGRFVVEPLRWLRVNVSQKQLLHQVIQVVVQVLLLHPQQLQLVHGEVELSGAVVASLFVPQLVDPAMLPGAPRSPCAAVVEPLAQLFGLGGCVKHGLDPVELVLRLCAAPDYQGGLAQTQSTVNEKRVGGFGAVVVFVVKLVGLEGVVGIKSVGASQKLWTRSHLTAATKN